MNLVQKLAEIANKLDEKGLYEEASMIDKLAAGMMQRKDPGMPQSVSPKNLFPSTKTPQVNLPQKKQVQLPTQNTQDELGSLIQMLKDKLGDEEAHAEDCACDACADAMMADTVELPEKNPGDNAYFEALMMPPSGPAKQKMPPSYPPSKPSAPKMPPTYPPSGPRRK